MKQTVLCLGKLFDGSKPYVIMDYGLQTIFTVRIIGTVCKCVEMDTGFRYLGK